MGLPAAVSRAFLAIAFVAFGLQHLIHGDFVTRVVVQWPDWLPLRIVWAWCVGLALMAAGASILARSNAAVAAAWLGALTLLSFAFISLPFAAADAAWGGRWTMAGKTLALGGGALLAARSAPGETGTLTARILALSSLGPWCFGAFLVLCGIQHFVHDVFVATLVPSWIPGAMFWTYFAGVALVAAGIGVVVPRTARLAGLLSGAMIFVWLIVLHIPRAIAPATRSANETTAVFEALAMSGIAFLIADGAARRRATTTSATRRRAAR